MAEQRITPSREALREALTLSGDILRNVELNEMPLTNIALKASRLARLLNEMDVQKIMEYEASGYPGTAEGIPPDVWRLAVAAGRKFEHKDLKTKELKEYAYTESIEELEQRIKTSHAALEAAQDRSVSITSANPYQFVSVPATNQYERTTIRVGVSTAAKRLASRRALIYRYAVSKHYELRFSGIAEDIFSRIRERVDAAVGETVPDAVQKLIAVHESLKSENPEDWSNAVHSCRRILQDLADAIFPPQEDRSILADGKPKTIKLGKDNYINRIMAFVQDHSNSQRYLEIVGSHLRFLGDRLDSVVRAAQKGSHQLIVQREEADRYVVYTYLLVGDVLSLLGETSVSS